MKFGIFDHMDTTGLPLGEQLENRLRLTEVYDRCGFRGYHLAEHHSTPLGFSPSPSVFLSAAAQRTRRLKLGTLVYLLPHYHPVRLIEEIAMLDQMSGGRLMLGVGRGVSHIEMGFYGVEYAKSQAMYQEALECLMSGLHNDILNFEGKYFNFKNVPMLLKPIQQPHPELWYGSLSPDTMVWAAANDANIVTILLADHAKAIVDRYKSEWAKLDKPASELPLVGVSRHIVVADTDEEARAIARRAYRRWFDSFAHLWHANGEAVPFIGALYPEEWDDLQAIGNGFAGSPQSIRRFVQEQVEKTGINYFVSWLAFGDMTLAESTRSAESFSRTVMPAFSSSVAAVEA